MKKLAFMFIVIMLFAFGCDDGNKDKAAPAKPEKAAATMKKDDKKEPRDSDGKVMESAKSGMETVKETAKDGAEAVKKGAEAATEAVSGGIGAAKDGLEKAEDAISKTAHSAAENLKEDAAKAKDSLSQAGKDLTEGVKEGADKVVEHGKDAVDKISGDSGSKSSANPWEAKLAHHNFVLKEFDGKDFSNLKNPDGTKRTNMPNMDFGQWPHLSGRMCNNYNGQVEINNDIIKMDKAATTMMMCAENEINELEQAFLKSMAEGLTMTYEKDTLTLKSKEHSFVFSLADHI